MKLEKIAELTNGNLVGAGATEIFRVANLETAKENEISFVEKTELTEQSASTLR